jgi:hypothetical protein
MDVATHNPVRDGCVVVEPDDGDDVVHLLTAASAIENTASILLKDHLVGINTRQNGTSADSVFHLGKIGIPRVGHSVISGSGVDTIGRGGE